jgi:hypothetical protein
MIDYTLLPVGGRDDHDRQIVRCGRCGAAGALETLKGRTHGEVLIVHAARLVVWAPGISVREALATCTYRAAPGSIDRIG